MCSTPVFWVTDCRRIEQPPSRSRFGEPREETEMSEWQVASGRWQVTRGLAICQFRDCCTQDAIDFLGQRNPVLQNFGWKPVAQPLITALRLSQ
jgi:hypothetical protein